MSMVVDRRPNGQNKSIVNRQRFLRRFRSQIKEAVTEAIKDRGVTDIDRGEKINIPRRDVSEPVFRHGNGGRRQFTQPGNREFVTGDRVARPPSGGGGGSGRGQASDSGEGLDDFVFELSREEFLGFFFEDLELPDLVKTELTNLTEQRFRRAGYTHHGVPCNINVERSLKGALARRIALRAPHRRRLHDIHEALDALDDDSPSTDDSERQGLELEKDDLLKRIRTIPFLDDFDLRYNHRVKQPIPTAQAVMFCLMDVSGSMDRERKDMAKRFFTLLYLFLVRNYERIDVVFIRHHTVAREVDEQDFFYSRETGGTVVSSALNLMHEVIVDRYSSSNWNIYAAQASDGDNWHGDSPICKKLLLDRIMPLLQYMAYVEINADEKQRLWREYEEVAGHYDNFAMRQIQGPADIYPVFHNLFARKPA